MSIIAKNISYTHPDREILFDNISFSINDGQKISLIGNNGSGKSTILKIICGSLQKTKGELSISGDLYYVPQHFGQYDGMTISEALGIDKKINALNSIIEGDVSEENFSILNDDWNIEERAISALNIWDLGNIHLSQKMEFLSGGEKTKVFLSGIIIHSPDIIIMDEPSNHLDVRSRQQLYDFIKNSNKTMIVVSHDRTLLNLLDSTYELTKNDIKVYGGNYEFYKEKKNETLNALQMHLDEKEKELRKARKLEKELLEKKQKRDTRGKNQKLKEGTLPALMNKLKSKAEESSAKLKDTHSQKITSISDDLINIRKKMDDTKSLKLDIENAKLHNGKELIIAKEINFGYNDKLLWENNLSFLINSGERVLISGANGSGKTTLLKLMLGKLAPKVGNLTKTDFKYVYIDQEYSIINDEMSVLNQVYSYNKRNLEEHEIKTLLHRFLFPLEVWDKPCHQLSGGEKMRLLFCCLIAENNAPDIFVLDEPTNNLDIKSIEIITDVLKTYKGTIIMISHDKYFTKDIGINRNIELQ